MPKVTPICNGAFTISHTTREVWGVDDDDATRETLIFSDLRGHQWASERFTDSFHPQEPNCPLCGMMWTNVVDTVPSAKEAL